MSEYIGTLLAEAERPKDAPKVERKGDEPSRLDLAEIRVHQFGVDAPDREKNPHFSQIQGEMGHPELDGALGLGKSIGSQSPDPIPANDAEMRVGHPGDVVDGVEESTSGFFEVSSTLEEAERRDRERRVYRARTVSMLRKYMRYSLETGRVPSLVGREFFRSNVTKYRVTTFEDRVIFVHDMDNCLQKLDEFSRQVLARVVLQEYEHEEAARIFGCTRMTVHRKLIEALDKLTDILIKVDLLSRQDSISKNSCQEGENDNFFISDCEHGE